MLCEWYSTDGIGQDLDSDTLFNRKSPLHDGILFAGLEVYTNLDRTVFHIVILLLKSQTIQFSLIFLQTMLRSIQNV